VTAPADSPVAGRRGDAAAVGAALLRFRVVAYVVGVGLITLVFVAVPLRYLGGMPAASKTISPIHGLMYMVYLALTYDLATRCGFTAKRTVLIMLAGTVPFMSFVAERKVSALVRGGAPRPGN
jgi:integral membrane protein